MVKSCVPHTCLNGNVVAPQSAKAMFQKAVCKGETIIKRHFEVLKDVWSCNVDGPLILDAAFMQVRR